MGAATNERLDRLAVAIERPAMEHLAARILLGGVDQCHAVQPDAHQQHRAATLANCP